MVQTASHKTVSGLNTHDNWYAMDVATSSVVRPRSATIICDNTILSRGLEVGNRWGFDYLTNPTTALVTEFFEYQNAIVEHQSDKTLWMGSPNSGARTSIPGTNIPGGQFVAPSATVSGATLSYRMDGTVSRGSLFFATTNGVYKLDAPAHTPVMAGAPNPLDMRATTTGSGGGWLSGNGQVGYRLTWQRTDANNQVLVSAPSPQAFVTNFNQVSCSITSAAGTATVVTSPNHTFTTGQSVTIAGATQPQYNGTFVVTVVNSTTFTYAVAGSPASPATGTITAMMFLNTNVSFTVPADVISGSDVWQLWRTKTATAQNPNTAPGDNEFLVAQATWTGTPLSIFTYNDTLPDTLRTTELYTNADQQGIQNANTRPPLACAMDVYYDYTFYANTALPYQITIELLGIAGIANGDSITITAGGTSRRYTFGASENIATQQFQLFTSGTPSINVQTTMQSLCAVINGDTAGLWYAQYTSGWTGAPGIVNIFARNFTSGAFSLVADTTTVGNQFTPALPTAGTSVSATSDQHCNRLFYSKFQQPDAVPLTQFFDVGRLDQPIERIIAQRDGLYILKGDGVYYLYGLAPPFTIIQLDATAQILAPSTAVKLNNQIYMLSNQGVVVVSAAGTQVVSLNIDPDITALLPFANLRTTAHAVAHESQRMYFLYVPTLQGDTYAKQAYVYHVFAQDWSHWTKGAAAGVALKLNRTMYISSGLENAVLQQRTTGTAADCADETQPITITGSTTTTINVPTIGNVTVAQITLTWTNSNFTPTAGWFITQSGNASKVVTATNTSGTTWVFTLDQNLTWSNGAASAVCPIYTHVRFPPDVMTDIGQTKCFRSVNFLTKQATCSQVTIECSTNATPSIYSFSFYRPLTQGWGFNPWGSAPWGDQPNIMATSLFTIDVPIPNNTGEALMVGFFHNVAQEQFFLSQCTTWFEPIFEYESAT